MFKLSNNLEKGNFELTFNDMVNNAIKNLFNADSEDDKLLTQIVDISDEDKEIILRKVFDDCRALGLSIVAEKGNLNLDEVMNFVTQIKTPCISGKWEKEEKSYKLTRDICQFSAINQSVICLYFKEALDGLIMGLGDSERYSRHRSMIYGCNDNCIDVIYDSNVVDYRWGDVPSNIHNELIPLVKRLEKKGIQLLLEGYSEKTLFYRIIDKNEDLKYFRKGFIIESIKKDSAEKIPGIELVETSPRAVIEGEF